MDFEEERAQQRGREEANAFTEFRRMQNSSKRKASDVEEKQPLSAADKQRQKKLTAEARGRSKAGAGFSWMGGFGDAAEHDGANDDDEPNEAELQREANLRYGHGGEASGFSMRTRSLSSTGQEESSQAHIQRLLDYMRNQERQADMQFSAEMGGGGQPDNAASQSAAVIRDYGAPLPSSGANNGVPGHEKVEFVPLRAVARNRLETTARSNANLVDELFDSSCDEIEQEALEIMERRKKRLQERRSRSGARSASSYRRHQRRLGSVATESLGEEASLIGAAPDYSGQPPISSAGADGSAPGGGGGGEPQGGGLGHRSMSSQMNCFLCRFGNREYDAVDKEDMKALIEALERGIGHRNLFAHAKMIHKMYMSTIYATAQARGEQMPVWRTHQVLEHICQHEMDPRINLYLVLSDLRTVLDELKNSLFIRDPATGETVLHSKHYREYQNTIKMIHTLYKAKPEQMNFFTESAALNLAEANKRVEGVRISKKVEYFGQVGRRK